MLHVILYVTYKSLVSTNNVKNEFQLNFFIKEQCTPLRSDAMAEKCTHVIELGKWNI